MNKKLVQQSVVIILALGMIATPIGVMINQSFKDGIPWWGILIYVASFMLLAAILIIIVYRYGQKNGRK